MTSTTPTPSTYRAAVAQNVRIEMARSNISGAQLGRMIDKSPAYVSRRLAPNTVHALSLDDLAAIAGALDVDVNDLTRVTAVVS